MKVAGWVMTILVLGVVLFVVIALMGGDRENITERIDRECRNSYVGEAAIMDCKVKMSVRYLGDQDRAKADSTYNRIR